MTGHRTSDSYFEEMWALGSDPWEHGSRWYETRKYDLTVASLPRQRYRRSFEPACGAGFLTRRLAARCDEVLASERSPRGVEATAGRCADLSNVRVAVGLLPEQWPDGTFDLVVLSELLYYFDTDDLDDVLARTARSLEPDGQVVAVHYRLPVPEHVRSGDEVHARTQAVFGAPVVSHIERQFVLDVFEP